MSVDNFIYVDREKWGATVPTSEHKVHAPAGTLFIHHSVTPVVGPDGYDHKYDPTDDPCRDMRLIEKIGKQRFGLFSYSYAFHPSGVVLEGAGLTVGAHTAGHNSTSFAFVLIGNYENHQPTIVQVEAMANMAEILIWKGKLLPKARGLQMKPHSSVKSTACPGHNMEVLMTRLWDRIGQ